MSQRDKSNERVGPAGERGGVEIKLRERVNQRLALVPTIVNPPSSPSHHCTPSLLYSELPGYNHNKKKRAHDRMKAEPATLLNRTMERFDSTATPGTCKQLLAGS